MSQPVKKPRGRPKGSKNKNMLLTGVSVERICEFHKFNPTTFLVQVANGIDKTEDWTKDDRLRAATKLHDSIYHKSAIPNGMPGEFLDGQCELVFEESADDFIPPEEYRFQAATDITVPGKAGAEVAQGSHAGE